MKNDSIVKLLQIAGGSFPIGGFSQSYGLETYVSDGKINTVEGVYELIETYIHNVVSRGELPLLIEAFRLKFVSDYEELEKLNRVAVAMKGTYESRQASLKSGKAMLRIGKEICSDKSLDDWYNNLSDRDIAFNVAFALIAESMNIDVEEAVRAFVFTEVNCIIQAAIKLVPLGNVEGQKLLTSLMDTMEDAAKIAFEIPPDEANAFAPALDMASIHHETLATRLYMS